MHLSLTCPLAFRGAARMRLRGRPKKLLQWAVDGGTLHVPSLWMWEILNAVAVVVKRRRITAVRGKEFLEQLVTFNVRVDQTPTVADFPRLYALASVHELTAYDVAYLDLAKRLTLPLTTSDHKLKRAALAEGVQVL